MRTIEECQRLAFEENLARRYFRDLEVFNRRGNPYYTVWIREKEYKNSYKLRLKLLDRQLHREPSLFVESPKTLWLYNYKGTINELGTSYHYHVHKNRDPNGYVKICYTGDWNSSYTCVLALHRGRIWIAAYEVHLLIGNTIAEIIDEWKEILKQQEQSNKIQLSENLSIQKMPTYDFLPKVITTGDW
ncbi:MAG: hypothetical protein AMJ75_02550 [Phycisphaerae bacterium SM1_79]|nr:MAG: hypothetical protein AMJ75_02550 [Phycisphaerae bacterium SM1_79]